MSTAIVAALAGSLAVAGTARSPISGTPAEAAFRLGDGSAACSFDGERLACRGARSASAVVLEADGTTYADDVDVEWSSLTPVLRSSESWFHGQFTCGTEAREILCTTLSGGVLAAGTARVAGAVPPR